MAGSVLNILFGSKRTEIGNIIIDASVEETHSAKAVATRNPVEDGVDVTDHVRLLPFELKIKGVISDTPSVFGLIRNPNLNVRDFVSTIIGKSKRSIDAFNKLVDLRNKRETFSVITNLKVYKNMILEEITVDRSAATANAIHFTASLTQIVKVGSKVLDVQSDRLATSVNKTGQTTQNLGNLKTDTIPENQPLSTSPSSKVNNSYAKTLFNLFR